MLILQTAVSLLILAGSIYAVSRKVDVRLALFVGALLMGSVALQPAGVLRAFLAGLTDYKSVLPITCAMGFGYVLQHTGCGEQLAKLLLIPFAKRPTLLLPGAVLIGFVVNITVVSQSSTAATVGAVLVPVLLAAGLSPLNTGAALLIGCSIGGELMNPAGPEYATVIRESSKVGMHVITGAECVAAALPLVLLNLMVATGIFWFIAARSEKKAEREEPAVTPLKQINVFKAFVPLVPLIVLFLVAKPFQLVQLPKEPNFLVSSQELEEIKPTKIISKTDDLEDTRLIGLAMLIGIGAAALACSASKHERTCLPDIAKAFFEGAGFAFANVISLIAVAAAFAEGIKESGIGGLIGHFVTALPSVLVPFAGTAALLFAVLCGSGIAATQGLFGIFAGPAAAHGLSLTRVGAFTSSGSAIGRTLSPVSAVGLMSARLTGQDVFHLVKRVAVPLVGAFAVTLMYALFR